MEEAPPESQSESSSSKMTGSKSFAERMEGLDDSQELKELPKDTGLSGLGAQLSNTQILENEMMGTGPAKVNLEDEDVEIDLLDDDGEEGTSLEEEGFQRVKYPEGAQSPKKGPVEGMSLYGTEIPKRGSSKFADESQSPKKAKYPDLSQAMSSQGSKQSGGGPPPVPPKHGSKSMTTDPNLRQAFRSQKPIEEMTMEELKAEEAANAAYEQEQRQAIHNSLKPKIRASTPSLSDDEFDTADEGPDSTLKERFKASKVEAEILRTRVFQLEKELKETQDFVFSMQPRSTNLNESEALAEFTSLCGSVEDWVQTKLGDPIEEMLTGKQKVSLQQPAKIILNNIPPPGREAFRYKDTDEYNVIAYIMRCLCDWILDRDFYCNIEKGGMEFLHSIEKAMRNLEPRRDHITCRTWRSETYTAITNRHTFAGYHNKLRSQVAYDLVHTLHLFAPRLDQEAMGASLLTSIIDPALALAHKLSLSVDKYSIRWTPYHTATWEQRQTMAIDLTQYECLDLIGGRTYKSQPKGKLLTYICDLAPGLVLERAQAQFFGEPKILKKPRILVAVTKEEDGFFQPVLPRHGEPCTLLGWMEEKLQSRNRFVFG